MMKKIKFFIIVVALTLLLPVSSCKKFDELNVNPNAKEVVSSNFVLTYVLANTAKMYNSLGDFESDVSGALQYIQRGTNEGSDATNHYLWARKSWSQFYDLLRNDEIIYKAAITNKNKFFEGISLTLRAFLFGTMTDLYGDIPYSESLQASAGIFFPKYDKQQDVYKGILADLKQASAILSDPGISQYKIDPASDILYKGNPDKWRKFANSLRMRYSMRLFNKKAEMQQAGVDIVSEFNDAASYSFKAVDDAASVAYIGTTEDNSAIGGLLNSSNPPFLFKPCKTMVDTLTSLDDPRLQRWTMPVQRKWDYNVTSPQGVTVANIFGESYNVTLIPPSAHDVDTSLYVGLPMGLATVDLVTYNDESGSSFTYPPERSPYISFLHPRYRENNETYIRMDLMTYNEVEFLLAEAAQTSGFSITDAEQHYKNGIIASLKRWGITDGSNGFNFDNYYNNPGVSYASASNKQERIMEQKWIAGWLTIEPWFDWRRTGYPQFKTGPVTQYGAAVPIRFMYPSPNQDPKYLVNYDAAVKDLERTVYVPTGQSADHNYSRIWLLQGTNKPY
jgi:hypothetical protein